MPAPRDIVIAGAGIGGLTTALALAAQGQRISVFEQSEALEEAGAGIQLSPNASRILINLGLQHLLAPVAVVPDALVVREASTGRPIVSMPLGLALRAEYGAPYWIVRRADLQAALLAAVKANPAIDVVLGAKVEDYAAHVRGLTLQVWRGGKFSDEHATALIGADGLWSSLRMRVGNRSRPRFRRRTAWRSVVPAEVVASPLHGVTVQLWLGRDAHLVHYPVAGGRLVNIVAIARDRQEEAGWSGAGTQEEVLAHFPASDWSAAARDLLRIPDAWRAWRLYNLPRLRRWGEGAVTLVGDAAHPMLPFLAQGAGTAIEDAAVLAACVARSSTDLPAAFRAYEAARRSRTAKVQAAARRTGHVYHLAGPFAVGRNLAMRTLGGDALIRRYGWIYGWRAPEPPARLRNEVAPTGETEAASMTLARGDRVSNPAASGGAAPE